MNIPNIITIMRILLVPITVWLLISGDYVLALVVFIMAGLSDAVDGFLARRYKLQTDLGAYLDPMADKALLVSTYVTLGVIKFLPAWLVILVITREVLIVGGVILSWLLDKPVVIRPLFMSKANTLAQIMLIGLMLGGLAFALDLHVLQALAYTIVAATTFLSGAQYMADWVRHMNDKGVLS